MISLGRVIAPPTTTAVAPKPGAQATQSSSRSPGPVAGRTGAAACQRAAAPPACRRSQVENARPYLNAPGYCYGESLVLLARMIREVGHCSVGATLDIGHAYLAARRYGWNLYDGVEAVAPLVRHIHLHDNFGRCSASYERKQYEMAAMGRGDMHMPIGWGEIPVWPILQLLPRYSGLVTLELRPRYRDKYREALAAARAMFKPANERHAS